MSISRIIIGLHGMFYAGLLRCKRLRISPLREFRTAADAPSTRTRSWLFLPQEVAFVDAEVRSHNAEVNARAGRMLMILRSYFW